MAAGGRFDRDDHRNPTPATEDPSAEEVEESDFEQTVLQAPDPVDLRKSSGHMDVVAPISEEMASRNSATMLGVRPATATTEVRAPTDVKTNIVPPVPPRTKPSSTLPNHPVPRLPHKPAAGATPERSPALRRKLKVTRTPAGYVVKDAESGQSCALNDSEYSLVRLCNGQRPMSEILVTARSLGLPVNLESVQAFVDKLDDQGFLVDDVLDAETHAFPPRGRWETGVRTLFQSGVRMLRQNNTEEAAGYFEAVLAQDPENVEAQELLEMTRTRVPVAPASTTPAPAAPRQTAPRVKSHTGDTLPPPARQLQSRRLQSPPPGWGTPHPSGRGVIYATPTTARAVATYPQHPGTANSARRRLVIALAVAAAIVIGAIVWMLVR